MNNLVLRFRVETTHRTLREVYAVRSALDQAKEDLDALDRLFPARDSRSNLGRSISVTVDRRVLSVRQKLANSIERLDRANFDDEEVMEDLRSALKSADELQAQADKVTSVVERLRRRWVEIGDDDRIGGILDQSMVRDANKWCEEVGGIASGLPAVDTPEAMIATWESWRTMLGNSQPLFDEYIDLLGGLALRSVGLCHEVCGRADTLLDVLLRRSSSGPWSSVAVPARVEALRMTPSQIIRLGFPGWTMWELPLAAHEFGHVVVSTHPGWWGLATSSGLEVSEDKWRTLCADVFAAFALGPSYACAALLVRLDPVTRESPAEGPSFDAVRARMITETLRVVAEDGFGDIVDVLDEQWAAAIEQTGATDLDEPARSAVRAATESVCDVLRSETPNAEYDAGRWDRIEEWDPALSVGVPDVSGSPDFDVRDVLNAAWGHRVRTPDASPTLARNAEDLWDAMTAPAAGAPNTARQQAKGQKGPRT